MMQSIYDHNVHDKLHNDRFHSVRLEKGMSVKQWPDDFLAWLEVLLLEQVHFTMYAE